MRILATGDLHYNIPRSKRPTDAIIAEILQRGGDVLMLLGDLAGMDLAVLGQVFEMLSPFGGKMLYTPGNHELWTPAGQDTLTRYHTTIADICRDHRVHYLDAAPLMIDGIGFAGRVGWYDYSFRTESLGIPLRFYEQKIAPGSATIRGEFKHLVADTNDIAPESMDVVCRWMDREHVRLPLSDTAFCAKQADGLRCDLASLSAAREVIVGLHHLPFAELVPQSHARSLQFATAFLGSGMLGSVCGEFANVRRVLCGHSHRYAECAHGSLRATAVGSTYTEKRIECFDV